MTIYTIGHSTRTLEEFVNILKKYKVNFLVDVRTVPKSRHVPQFNEDNLSRELPKANISYQHLAELGGLRKVNKDSVNLGWHNASFRGYADYMQTSEFKKGINVLIRLADVNTVCIMCAEAVPWRCHRSLIGDALLVRKVNVIDIFDQKKSEPEKLTSFAKVNGQKITYPPES